MVNQIVKECYDETVFIRGFGSKPVSTTCVIRFDDNSKLTSYRLAKIFNEIAKDFSCATVENITLEKDCVKIKATAPTKEYKKKDPVQIGSQG